MTATTDTTSATSLTGERADLLETLAAHRFFLRHTVRDLTDEQAALRPTASELCLGGLIKHVTAMEEQWVAFITEGTSAVEPHDENGEIDWEGHARTFQMLPDDTLTGVLERYEDVARRTTEVVSTLPDLDVSHPLPEAPWFEPGARRSARRALMHIVGETAQHAGHADILRESIDGAKTMG